ncbi:MAG: hypothetical protein GY756_03540 [bacterium]|nr:hypothetical protein [bacterium]
MSFKLNTISKTNTIIKDLKLVYITEDLSSLNSGNYLIEFVFDGKEKVSKQLIIK